MKEVVDDSLALLEEHLDFLLLVVLSELCRLVAVVTLLEHVVEYLVFGVEVLVAFEEVLDDEVQGLERRVVAVVVDDLGAGAQLVEDLEELVGLVVVLVGEDGHLGGAEVGVVRGLGFAPELGGRFEVAAEADGGGAVVEGVGEAGGLGEDLVEALLVELVEVGLGDSRGVGKGGYFWISWKRAMGS